MNGTGKSSHSRRRDGKVNSAQDVASADASGHPDTTAAHNSTPPKLRSIKSPGQTITQQSGKKTARPDRSTTQPGNTPGPKKIRYANPSGDKQAKPLIDPDASTEGIGELEDRLGRIELGAPSTITPAKSPRTRERHQDSEGDSESGDPKILYRSLRDDEDPINNGLQPPAGHDPSKTASQHITAGTRAKTKSGWISASRSIKVAGSHASRNKNGRVVKFRKPEHAESFDLTNSEEARIVFPARKGASLNTAKASQEVVIRGEVGPENILAVFDALAVDEKAYEQASPSTRPGFYCKAKSRTNTKSAPQPFVLEENTK